MARAFFVKCIIMNATINDAFAKFIGIKIVQATPQCAICELELTSNHLNGVGVVQGGVLFTMADLALAVAANADEADRVTLSSHIDFLKAVGRGTLLAKATPIKIGRTTALYNVSVVEKDSGVLLANFQGTAFRIK